MIKGLSKKQRLRDLVAIISLVLVAVIVTLVFKPIFLVATALFFGLPAAYLLWRKPSNFLKATLAGLLLGGLYGFSFDYVAELNHAWGWSTNTFLALPLNFFGVVSLDIMVWYFLWVFLTILFYEYFAEYDLSKKLSKNFWPAVLVGFLMLFAVVGISKAFPAALLFQYGYLVVGSITLIPFIWITWRKKHIFSKVTKIIPFFAFLYLAFELTALHTNLWSFPGQYIGSVSILHLEFPLEEMIFWVLISSAVTAAYHEYVIDDGK